MNLTDAEGNVTKTYTYDAFGVEKNIDSSDTNAFRYRGEYYDTETGTIYLRARYYNTTTGRFISRDSYAVRKFDYLSTNLHKIKNLLNKKMLHFKMRCSIFFYHSMSKIDISMQNH